MYLNLLEEQEKSSFLILAKKMISADGKIDDKELEMLELMKVEMQIEDDEKDYTNIELSEICKNFQSTQSKVAVLLELIGLSISDGDFGEDERREIEQVASIFQIPLNKINEYTTWVKDMLDLTQKGFQFLNEN